MLAWTRSSAQQTEIYLHTSSLSVRAVVFTHLSVYIPRREEGAVGLPFGPPPRLRAVFDQQRPLSVKSWKEFVTVYFFARWRA